MFVGFRLLQDPLLQLSNMSNAALDENSRPTLTGTLNTNGKGIVRIKVDPTSHALKVNNGTTGSDNGNNNGNANLDENSKPVLTAVSSADGKTVVEVYALSDGSLMIDPM